VAFSLVLPTCSRQVAQVTTILPAGSTFISASAVAVSAIRLAVAVKITTDIDKVASVVRKHKKLVFDEKLANYFGITPKRLHNYFECLEKYNFLETYMDPVHGMTVVWKDNTDLITNGYSQQFITRELQNRRLDTFGKLKRAY
ncbi:MAG: hypothetical protein V1703_04895, partial [Candidatus Altiarchaeota archaeon]